MTIDNETILKVARECGVWHICPQGREELLITFAHRIAALQRKELEKQRDELLKALEDFSNYVHSEQCSTDGAVNYSNTQINRLVFKTRAAIASVKGSQGK